MTNNDQDKKFDNGDVAEFAVAVVSAKRLTNHKNMISSDATGKVYVRPLVLSDCMEVAKKILDQRRTKYDNGMLHHVSKGINRNNRLELDTIHCNIRVPTSKLKSCRERAADFNDTKIKEIYGKAIKYANEQLSTLACELYTNQKVNNIVINCDGSQGRYTKTDVSIFDTSNNRKEIPVSIQLSIKDNSSKVHTFAVNTGIDTDYDVFVNKFITPTGIKFGCTKAAYNREFKNNGSVAAVMRLFESAIQVTSKETLVNFVQFAFFRNMEDISYLSLKNANYEIITPTTITKIFSKIKKQDIQVKYAPGKIPDLGIWHDNTKLLGYRMLVSAAGSITMQVEKAAGLHS